MNKFQSNSALLIVLTECCVNGLTKFDTKSITSLQLSTAPFVLINLLQEMIMFQKMLHIFGWTYMLLTCGLCGSGKRS